MKTARPHGPAVTPPWPSSPCLKNLHGSRPRPPRAAGAGRRGGDRLANRRRFSRGRGWAAGGRAAESNGRWGAAPVLARLAEGSGWGGGGHVWSVRARLSHCGREAGPGRGVSYAEQKSRTGEARRW